MVERAFIDTNLFLRYLTNDIPEQADAVEVLLERAEAGEVQLVTNRLVMAEVVWTLESFYKKTKAEVQDAVLAILNTPGLDLEARDQILRRSGTPRRTWTLSTPVSPRSSSTTGPTASTPLTASTSGAFHISGSESLKP